MSDLITSGLQIPFFSFTTIVKKYKFNGKPRLFIRQHTWGVVSSAQLVKIPRNILEKLVVLFAAFMSLSLLSKQSFHFMDEGNIHVGKTCCIKVTYNQGVVTNVMSRRAMCET